ncbi:hypothetical protein VULLAG_LOCUS21387 [Vulpes lagopus]
MSPPPWSFGEEGRVYLAARARAARALRVRGGGGSCPGPLEQEHVFTCCVPCRLPIVVFTLPAHAAGEARRPLGPCPRMWALSAGCTNAPMSTPGCPSSQR